MDHSFHKLLAKLNIIDMNVTGVSGTGNLVLSHKIETIGVKNIQIPLRPPAQHLPQLWHVPPVNRNFIGRNILL